jgi:hypothetical protein
MWCRDGRIRVGRSQIRPRVPFSARRKAVVLHSLDIFALFCVQPTMFQKHALRRNAGEEDDDKMTVRPLPPFLPPFFLPSAPPSSLISQIDLSPDAS